MTLLKENVWQGVEEITDLNGELHFDGCSTLDLVKEFGSPLYIYSENRIRKNIRRVFECYQTYYPDFEIYYAIKANNNPAIIDILASEGAGADCSCIPEILLAQRAGIPQQKILYSGVYNSDDDLEFAVKNGVRLNIEDLSQLKRLNNFSVPEFLSLRVNPGIGKSGEEGLIFAGPESKFGIPEEQLKKAYSYAKDIGVKKFGVHMMTGSNILEPEYFSEVVGTLMDLIGPISRDLGISFEFIDIGGSLGVPYKPEQSPLDLNRVAKEVSAVLKEKSEEFQFKKLPKLIHEPGRYLVADAGMLLSTVTSIKRSDLNFLGIDAGMHTLLRPALYEAYHHILYANNLNAGKNSKAQIVGQVCENTDLFAKGFPVSSNIGIGDTLALLDSGAYGYCMSSNYNTKPRPAEVLVNNGKAKLIRRQENFEDLIRLYEESQS